MAYELLAGRPPFQAATPQGVLAAQVTEPADPVSKYRDQVSPQLEALVMKCLAKKPADRWQSSDEMLPQLEALSTLSAGMTPVGTMPLSRAPRKVWRSPAFVAGVAATLVVVAAMAFFRSAPFTVTSTTNTRISADPGLEFQPAISPDGKLVAYADRTRGPQRIVVRSAVTAATGGGTRLAEEGVGGWHLLPTWASDGERIRFYRCPPTLECDWRETGKLGGSVVTIGLPRPDQWHYWSADGTLGAFSGHDSIFVYATDTQEAHLLAVHTAQYEGDHSYAWSPDGRFIAYVNGNIPWRYSANVSTSSIWVVEAGGGVPVQITTGDHMDMSPQWLPDSHHLLFVSDRDGPRSVYSVEVGPDGPRSEVQHIPGIADPHSISLSADGKKLAYAKFSATQNIWSFPIPRSGVVSLDQAEQVTRQQQKVEEHDVSPDGDWIIFDSDVGGYMSIYKARLDGGSPQLVVDLGSDVFAPVWSPDGTEIAFLRRRGSDIRHMGGAGRRRHRATAHGFSRE